MFVVAVYVDNIVLGGAKMIAVKAELSLIFEIMLHYFLRVKVIQDQLAGVI